ncbi:DNA glycosylase AlkZ-like family protein [Lactococcus insecticola]|uniref:Winged helix-turn-helix domain-containing protein n=1 Tax=Pseudolactococcus insecticola TaxID=2709158 RepID=A0A6A0B5V8_9LACT|nr:crosslink repair DNA glycosylase YcaQ family protein [Lactococcus insecticola]GFH40622.1 hypothetical protein Hs20B_10200 [Lactococcus insecticola]
MAFNNRDIKKLQLKKQFPILTLSPSDNNSEATMKQLINSLGFVQLDSMRVMSARSQDIFFYNRDKSYKINDYLKLYKEDFAAELYLHALSLVPSHHELTHLLHSSRYKKLEATNEKDNYIKQFKLLTEEKSTLSHKKENWDMSDKDVVTNALWRAGLLKISRNEKFNKLYTLKTEVQESHLSQTEISEQMMAHFVLLSLQNIGLATFDDMKRYFNLKVKDLENAISRLSKQHQIMLAGQYEGEDYYILPEDEKLMDVKGVDRDMACKFLSPFDNAIKDRVRLNRLFDFDYKLESYMPKNKRKFGYFALPILVGDEIVGAIDLKVNDKTKTLLVKQLTLKSMTMKKYLPDIEENLQEFKAFTNMDEISWEEGIVIL